MQRFQRKTTKQNKNENQLWVALDKLKSAKAENKEI